MFEAAACCGMVLVEIASVSVETLRDLHRLLCAVEGCNESGMLQGKHPMLPDSGGAYAKPKISKDARSADDFSSDAADTAVAKHADGGARTNVKITGAIPALASARATRRAARRQGGVR